MNAMLPPPDPAKRLGAVCAEIVADIRFQRQCRKLHDLGPRVLAEFLAELMAEHLIGVSVDAKLERYTALSPEQIRAAGGGTFTRPPLHVVGGAR